METEKFSNATGSTKNSKRAGKWDAIKQKLLQKPPKKRLTIISGIGVILIVIAGVVWLWQQNNQPEPVDFDAIVMPEPVPQEPADTRVPSPLTGELVEPELAGRRVTAVMIENSNDARPQSGLQEAGVVFEAIAEGGITRFMALYQEQRPDNIGPIRSARPYYVEWARGFDASYVHSGGSAEALALIPKIGVKDLDHGKYGNSLASRVSFRFAPHNVYTSMDRIDEVAKSAGFNASDFKPFARLEEVEEESAEPETQVSVEVDGQEPPAPESAQEAAHPKATEINFNISSANYNTSYTYNPESKLYPRTMAQRAHTDKDSDKRIAPRVVIAMETSYGIQSNRIHSVYKTVGSGDVTIFQNGEVIKGKWRKSSQTASLEFIDNSGEPIELAPGQTWITVIAPGRVSFQ